MYNRKKEKTQEERFPKTVEQILIEERQNEVPISKEENRNPDAEKKEKNHLFPRTTTLTKLLLWVIVISAAVFLGFVTAGKYGQTIVMHESSMEPAISPGQKLLIQTTSGDRSDIRRGDIIVFTSGREGDAGLRIKRVIGLPGETIAIRDGQVQINGETYMEGDYPAILDPGLAEDAILLDSGEYFVLGDNRNGSEDSRHSSVGNVDEDQIIGKLWFSLDPIGFID